MAKIERVIGRRVWDSCGRPAVEAEVWAAGDLSARAIAPSSARVPKDAAQELRDGSKAFEGFGVSKAVASFETEIQSALIGLDVRDQEAIDRRLIALDQGTGSPVWSVQTTDPTKAYSITATPRIARDKVVIGNAGSEYGVRGYITAYDAETGKQIWRFYTVPGDPKKGFESIALEAAAKIWEKVS